MDFAKYTSALRLNGPLIRVSSDISHDFPGHDLLSPNPGEVFPSASESTGTCTFQILMTVVLSWTQWRAPGSTTDRQWAHFSWHLVRAIEGNGTTGFSNVLKLGLFTHACFCGADTPSEDSRSGYTHNAAVSMMKRRLWWSVQSLLLSARCAHCGAEGDLCPSLHSPSYLASGGQFCSSESRPSPCAF